MKAGEKLIHKPSLQPGLQQTFFSVATLMAWTAYLYLWAPLATLLLWWGGFRSAYLQLYLQHNQVNLPLLMQLLLLALVCAALLIGWAEYNRIRFQGVDRRGRQADADLLAIADAMGTPLEQAAALQTARIATVRVDSDISVLRVALMSDHTLPQSEPVITRHIAPSRTDDDALPAT